MYVCKDVGEDLLAVISSDITVEKVFYDCMIGIANSNKECCRRLGYNGMVEIQVIFGSVRFLLPLTSFAATIEQ